MTVTVSVNGVEKSYGSVRAFHRCGGKWALITVSRGDTSACCGPVPNRTICPNCELMHSDHRFAGRRGLPASLRPYRAR
jgi:hypothetical protein